MQANPEREDFLQAEPTPHQTAGPFYPGAELFTRGSDLTLASTKPAQGEVIYVHARVQDMSGHRIVGARVEIWQACASGKYRHDADSNPAELDPQFGYWGEATTDAFGECHFRTVTPGIYPADEHWDRPPHIHFRVLKSGYREVITQMYFKGHPLNAIDEILLAVAVPLRESLIVDFQPSVSEPTARTGCFTVTLARAE